MKHKFDIEVRRFSVIVEDAAGKTVEDHIILTKQELQAAQLVGQSSKELISRLYGRNGLRVVSIGAAERKTISVDLCALWGGGFGG